MMRQGYYQPQSYIHAKDRKNVECAESEDARMKQMAEEEAKDDAERPTEEAEEEAERIGEEEEGRVEKEDNFGMPRTPGGPAFSMSNFVTPGAIGNSNEERFAASNCAVSVGGASPSLSTVSQGDVDPVGTSRTRSKRRKKRGDSNRA